MAADADDQPRSPRTGDHAQPDDAATSATTIAEADDTNPNDEPTTDSPADEPTEEPGPLYSVFSSRVKMFLVVMTVFATFFSPFSTSIYFPAITPIATEYARSISDLNLSVTTYQIMQAVAPLFFGDLSDQIGRRPVYILSFAIYLGANIGLAVQHSYAALMVLRAMQSTGSSATVAIGNAVVADFTTSAERGGSIAAVQASVMFAPALATTLGGILSEFLGWRSTFWFLVIAAGVFLVIYIPFVPEVSLLSNPLSLPLTPFLRC